MDPLGSIQVCLYYVKQMNTFPILTKKIIPSLTGTRIINSILYATVKTHVMLRIGLGFLNEEPDENLQTNLSLSQKFLFFFSCRRSWKSLFNQCRFFTGNAGGDL